MRNCLCLVSVFFMSVSLWGDGSWELFKNYQLLHLRSIQGWCSLEKAEKMMDLIYETKPQLCVEIGVFGGSSIYPTAEALLYQGGGVVYAIDPWSKEECLEGYEPNDPNYVWWNTVDLEAIYQGFLGMLDKYNLAPFCNVLRAASLDVVSQFEEQSIDILHVDGNHTEDTSYSDIYLFFPKVKEGGYIWLDDICWLTPDGKRTLEKGLTFLIEKCEVVTFVDNGGCVLLKKIRS